MQWILTNISKKLNVNLTLSMLIEIFDVISTWILSLAFSKVSIISGKRLLMTFWLRRNPILFEAASNSTKLCCSFKVSRFFSASSTTTRSFPGSSMIWMRRTRPDLQKRKRIVKTETLYKGKGLLSMKLAIQCLPLIIKPY